jgi:hypothetical protein
MRLRGSLIVVLSLVATAFPAQATPVDRVPELMGQTTVRADGSASAVVSLGRDVEISTRPFRNRTIEIDTKASFAAVVLRQIARKPIEVMAFFTNACPQQACGRLNFSIVNDPSKHGFPKKITLPAGRYVLDVVSDGAPVSAILSLPQLGGHSSVTATGASHGTAGALPATVEDTVARTFYSASTHPQLKGIGLSMVGVWLRADQHVITNIDDCVGEDPVPGYATPSWMTCNGAGGTTIFRTDDLGGGYQFLLGYALLDEGSYVHSLTYESLATIEVMEAMQFSIDYGSGIRKSFRSGAVFGWGD